MPKKYEMSFELNGEIDPRISRTFDSISKDVTDLGKDLNTLGTSKGLDSLTRDAEDANGAIFELKENFGEFGEVLGRVGQYTGAYALITGITGSIGEMAKTIGELDAQSGQLAAATGATAGELEELQEISESLYLEGLGEGVNELTDALVVARNVTKQHGDELEQTTKNAIVLKDVFQFDMPESLKATDTMMRQFGITSEQSMNLLAQGAQKGLDKSGELLDSANEYAPHFASLGFTANQMFDTFSAGLEAGAFNLDKVGDAVKEFNIRSKDMSKTSNEAYEALGLNAEKMSQTFAKGGDEAQAAFKRIVGSISSIEDPVKKNAIGVALFGTQFEDLEKDVIAAMGSAQSQFIMTTSTMEDMAAVKYDNLTQELKVLGRELMDEIVIPIGEDLLPVLRDLTDWASDNKDLIKALALAVPAALLTKNAISMSKDLTNVGKSLFDTTSGVSKFSNVVGLMTNPIGLAVGAVGALALGVVTYKKHQEEARQALINMGDELEGVFDNYTDIEHQTKRTQDLTREYDRLTAKINDAKTPADELAEARRKQKLVEEELIQLNPEILKAEDAKNSNFREQLDLVDKLNSTQLEMEKRKLDAEILDTKSQIPQLKEEYQTLQDNLSEFDQAYQEARESYVQYQDFINQKQKIIDTTTGEEKVRQLHELASEIKEITGQFYGNSWANMDFDFKSMKESFESNFESLNKTQQEIINTEQTFQKYYDTQVKLIELDIGAPIEDMSNKYDTLTVKEKERFDAAMTQLQEINQEMANLPVDKQINVDVVWSQSGNTTAPLFEMQSMQQYADGGYADRPSIFGEAGPEMAIPLNNKPRSHALLETANRMMGHSGNNGDTYQISWVPQVTVQGGNGNVQKEVIQALNQAQDEFERRFKMMIQQQRRVNF